MGPTVTRCCLTVPASRRGLLARAVATGADEVVVDLEDAVAPPAKDAARDGLVDELATVAAERPRVVVRVNGTDSRWALDDLLAVGDLLPGSVAGVVVPKVESRDELAFAAEVLRHRRGGDTAPLLLGALVESARGLRALDDLLAHDAVDHVIVGYGDLAASLGMPTTAIGTAPSVDDPWHAVRSRVVVAARAAGVRALDGPYADHHDLDGTRRSAERAHALGFDGAWVIHPRQVPVVTDVFAVTDEQVAQARAVLAALDEARARGLGAASVDGRMVDEASRRLAERRLAAASGGGRPPSGPDDTEAVGSTPEEDRPS